MTVSAGDADDWITPRAKERGLPHGSQRGMLKGTKVFGARCTEEEWRALKIAITVQYERS